MSGALIKRRPQSAVAQVSSPRKLDVVSLAGSTPSSGELGSDEALLSVARSLSSGSEHVEDRDRARAALNGTEQGLRRIAEDLSQLSRLYQRASADITSRTHESVSRLEDIPVGGASDAMLPPVVKPMFVAEVVRRPLVVERPMPSPPLPLRTTTLIPPPLPSVGLREYALGSRATLEDTLRMPALKVTGVTRARVILIACATVVCLGAVAMTRVASSSASRPQPQTIPAREREVAAALPVVQKIPTPVIDVAPRTEVSLANVRVLWGKVSRPDLLRAMRRQLATIKRCIEQHPHEALAPSKDAVLRLWLGRNGGVRSVHASSLAPADGCIARSLRQKRFPRSTTGLLADVTLRVSE